MRTLWILAALAGLAAGPASAHEFELGALTIEHPWARPAASGNGAAYFTIENAGSAADRLTSISSPVAATAELHTSMVDAQGVASMHPVQAVDVPAGGQAKLAPGGLHVMLMGLSQPLKEGQSFPLTLAFEHGGKVTVQVEVERKPSHGEAGGGHEHKMAPAN